MINPPKDRFYSSLLEIYEKNIDDELSRYSKDEILTSSEAFLNIHVVISDFQKDGVAREDLLGILKRKLNLK